MHHWRFVGLFGPFVALSLAMPAAAETLRVEGVYPAGRDEAAPLQSIALDSFGGVQGPALAIQIGDRLRAVAIDGQPWFALLPRGGARADAVLRGTADTRVSHANTKQTRNRCVAEDADGKCTEKKDVEVQCVIRTVALVYSVRLVGADGSPVYSEDGEPSRQITYCPKDDKNVKTTDAMTGELLRDIAGSLRAALAPSQELREIRVMESRKGLSGDAARDFKEAVRLTKSDPAAACAQWENVSASSPDNLSVVFNLGLCAEERGDLDEAEALYRQALKLSPGRDYPTEGLDRVLGRKRAEWQLAAHYRDSRR